MTQTPGSDQPAAENPQEEIEVRPSRLKWVWITLILAAGLGGGAWYFMVKRNGALNVQYRSAPVTRGDLVQEVTANGSINPVKNVQVGAQVSGIVQKLYVDYNSKVKEGQLIAQIEPSTYQKNLLQAEAQLSVAKAGLELADVSFRRAKELFKDKLISASDYDTALANFHQAEATVKINDASVERAKVDLSYTEIHAPISGVVIERAVDEGQTVASSFNTPKLFVIANDLSKMQIEAAVSEADVGGVEEGERVNFSVDAFPNRKFFGTVQQVRFDPITNQNVVTYTAVVGADNPDLKLRPGMTATAKIVTAQKDNVLRVPNAALRFRPPPGAPVQVATNAMAGSSTNKTGAVATDELGNPIPPWRAENRRPNPGEFEKWRATLTPEQQEKFQQMMQQMRQRRAEGGDGPGGSGGAPKPRPEGPTTATVYVLDQPQDPAGAQGTPTLRPVTVKAGITDGAYTEILDGLKEGDIVVSGTSTGPAAAAAGPTSNPFSPFGGRRR